MSDSGFLMVSILLSSPLQSVLCMKLTLPLMKEVWSYHSQASKPQMVLTDYKIDYALRNGTL